jgi:hypothetical protein
LAQASRGSQGVTRLDLFAGVGPIDEWHLDLEKLVAVEKLNSCPACSDSRKKLKSKYHSSHRPTLERSRISQMMQKAKSAITAKSRVSQSRERGYDIHSAACEFWRKSSTTGR